MKRSREHIEFYVGYAPWSWPALARFWRRGVVVLLLVMGLCGAFFGAAQDRLAPKAFDWTEAREFDGVLRLQPVPHLEVRRPGNPGRAAPVSRWPLVAPGKFGAQAWVAPWVGQAVRLRAHRIQREDQTMLELVPGSIHGYDAGQPSVAPEALDWGTVVLEGEIVDSKCYLGVMNPGSTKLHRACAIRCISGGIPPVLLVRDAEGAALYVFLVDESGHPVNDRVLGLVARPVRIEGRLRAFDETLVLQSDPATYRILR